MVSNKNSNLSKIAFIPVYEYRKRRNKFVTRNNLTRKVLKRAILGWYQTDGKQKKRASQKERKEQNDSVNDLLQFTTTGSIQDRWQQRRRGAMSRPTSSARQSSPVPTSSRTSYPRQSAPAAVSPQTAYRRQAVRDLWETPSQSSSNRVPMPPRAPLHLASNSARTTRKSPGAERQTRRVYDDVYQRYNPTGQWIPRPRLRTTPGAERQTRKVYNDAYSRYRP